MKREKQKCQKRKEKVRVNSGKERSGLYTGHFAVSAWRATC